jgi:hypothetical protein
MHRSQFEQLIDAGLATRQRPAERAAPFRAFSGAAFPLTPDASGFDRNTARVKPHLSARDLRRAYGDWAMHASSRNVEMASDEQSAGQPESQPQPSLTDLMKQLSNHRTMTRAELQALRRQLARCLHPDLVPNDERQSATAEMARLNALIDTALQAQAR